jgi:GNAT superfamily N-acetyltransferase
MENKVSIRPATPEDGDTVLHLIQGLADYEKLPPPDEAAIGRMMRDAFGEHPRFNIYLAEVEGQAAGYAFVFETYSTFAAYPKLYMEDLFVRPEYRGQKVGLALFRHCVAEAERRGCAKLEWAVLDWNTSAQNFYKRLGAEHSQDWFPYYLNRDKFRAVLDTE